jgi:NAD(P)-dependent dehydrogenase (short-subunit alcohol dehydrogenase family)
LAIEADVCQREQVEKAVHETLVKLGKIDVLVNNAAVLGPIGVPAVEYDDEVWQRVLAVNLTGAFLCCKAVAREMIERGKGGKIVNVSSIAGKIGYPGLAAYGASKAGLINLTQTLALELAPYNINVNAVCPGSTLTDMGTGREVRSLARKLGISIEEATAQVYAELIKAIPLGRVAQPEEQANAVAFLASKESDFVTGIALNVTGGRVMAP